MKKIKLFASAIILGATISSIIAPERSFAASQQMVVDLSTETGDIKHGATGFLYGLGDEGIPTDNMLAPIKPQGTGQKAPDGLQHPNGDALKIAPQFFRNQGKEIQIYMQDIYKEWPYENLGIQDYLSKADTIVNQVKNDPYYGKYVYVPFNEPDGNWYPNILNYNSSNGATDRQKFFEDWKLVFNNIRSLDPNAQIAGPNLTHYHAQFHEDFMNYAKENNVLPDQMTWHELQDSFFTSYYNNYNHFRDLENQLGLPARPIVINEYGRFTGDLGVPGNLVQWITRFENTKVDAYLAYWTTAGALNDLVTENNQATGGWWLYKWYGEMTGRTVQVTPPSVNGSLQGVATLDKTKKQARLIFGGSLNSSDVFPTDIVVKGFDAVSELGNSVHVTVWGIDHTGLNPSAGPYYVQEGDYAVTNGQILVNVPDMKALSAYQLVITPDKDLTTANHASRYEAEYADISGSAKITYGHNTGYSGTSFTEGYGSSSDASTNFVVTAPSNGYYDVKIRYSAGPLSGAPVDRSIRMLLNGSLLKDVSLPGTADWNTWNSVTVNTFLTAGINRISLQAYTSDDSDAANFDYIDVVPSSGIITAYEAEATGNEWTGAAAVSTSSSASGGKYVGYIGLGEGNTLTFNDINATDAGTYRMIITYANGELGDGASNYNANIVDRAADISINGGTTQKVYFRNTLGWSNYKTTVMDVQLQQGKNKITFSNGAAYAPDIDKIEIARPVN
ncbi:carbohydrate-binding protein [Paenibacillus sp.]